MNARDKRRVVIIGLDGVPYNLLEDFASSGIMPQTHQIIKKGIFKPMQSSIPEISSVAWSSVITGKNPGEHGIYGFTDIPTNTYRLTFPNFNSLKIPAFWENNAERKYIIFNVPSTFPARPLNGIHISGFVALDLERAVYPEILIPWLKEIDYRIDVESSKAHQSMDLFLRDLFKTHAARLKAYRRFWNEDWDTFMFVLTGTDRILHFLWDAYQDVNHRYHEIFLDYFRHVDQAIGEIYSQMTENDVLFMLSDHGFEKLNFDIYINTILKKEGFLKLEDQAHPNFKHITNESRAFALDPARIYIHSFGRYPRGEVSLPDQEAIVKDLKELFKNYEINGKKIIRHIYRKEEVYFGPELKQAPDLILIGEKGYNLKASMASKEVCSKGIFTGKHSLDNAFLLACSDSSEIVFPEKPTVYDVLPLIKQLEGVYK